MPSDSPLTPTGLQGGIVIDYVYSYRIGKFIATDGSWYAVLVVNDSSGNITVVVNKSTNSGLTWVQAGSTLTYTDFGGSVDAILYVEADVYPGNDYIAVGITAAAPNEVAYVIQFQMIADTWGLPDAPPIPYVQGSVLDIAVQSTGQIAILCSDNASHTFLYIGTLGSWGGLISIDPSNDWAWARIVNGATDILHFFYAIDHFVFPHLTVDYYHQSYSSMGGLDTAVVLGTGSTMSVIQAAIAYTDATPNNWIMIVGTNKNSVDAFAAWAPDTQNPTFTFQGAIGFTTGSEYVGSEISSRGDTEPVVGLVATGGNGVAIYGVITETSDPMTGVTLTAQVRQIMFNGSTFAPPTVFRDYAGPFPLPYSVWGDAVNACFLGVAPSAPANPDITSLHYYSIGFPISGTSYIAGKGNWLLG